MTHRSVFLLATVLSLILFGCSDDAIETSRQAEMAAIAEVPADKAPGGTLTAEELAMPLNTPISAVGAGGRTEKVVEEDPQEPASAWKPDPDARELEWDDLMPEDYRIEEILMQINAGEIADDDPRIDEAMAKVKELFSKAPVVEELNNQKVMLPGFVVPLDPDNEKMTDFLLVPYYGACIHVPPPPPNQTVFVTGKESNYKLFDTVWVTGEILIERIDNDLGESGYSIRASEIAPYE